MKKHREFKDVNIRSRKNAMDEEYGHGYFLESKTTGFHLNEKGEQNDNHEEKTSHLEGEEQIESEHTESPDH